MTIYAVMKTGGKEYRVSPGDIVRVEKLAAAPGATVEIDQVCLIASGQDVIVGSPTVADARVVAEVFEEGHGERIVTFKKKRRNHYQMTMEDVQSYSVLRIREIAVGKTVYAAAASPCNMAASVTPPPPPPRISNAERRVSKPQTDKHPPASPPPALTDLLPRVAEHFDAPVAAKAASDQGVGTQPQRAQPSGDAAQPVHTFESPPAAPSSTETPPARVTPLPSRETAAPTPTLEEREPRKRSYGIAALVVAVLVIVAGLLVWGGTTEVATVAASPQAARPPAVPQQAAKEAPRHETAVKNPAAASTPSAPVQPPE